MRIWGVRNYITFGTLPANRTVTLKTPIRRVVVARMGPHEPAIILAKERIVGISDGIKQYRKDIVERTDMMDTPSVGLFFLSNTPQQLDFRQGQLQVEEKKK